MRATTNDWDEAIRNERVGPRWLRRTVLPAFLVLVCPPAVMLVWYTHVRLGGSLTALGHVIAQRGLFRTIATAWGPYVFGTKPAWAILGVFVAFEVALMKLLPGPRFEGPITPKGNVPVYKANGLPAFFVTLALFLGASYGLRLFPPGILYDHLGGILGALNLASLLFCVFLYFKGRYAPSTSDASTSGNPVFDYYWGTELYPSLFGVSVKMFTNCRFGMMAWPLLVLSFAAKQHQLYGLRDSMVVAVVLQLLKVSKFFRWETGYLRSLDIMHDRAGFYICWGCLVWVPAIYTASTLYLVSHPRVIGTPLAALLTAIGALAILVQWSADEQRQRVRATDGETLVWGKPPALIRARYTTDTGERKENLLLVSGYWGLSRHFHYVPEILVSAAWTAPCGFEHALPWFYVAYLTVLLVDRAFRDDRRCAAKYGSAWDLYRAKVPYRIVPFLF